MVWLISILLYVHILAAIFWFGSSMTIQFVFIPALKGLPYEAQHPWLQALAGRYAPVVGVTGILNTPYGITWLGAIILAIPLAILGGRFIGPVAEKMAAAQGRADVMTLSARISSLGRIEFAGMLVMLALMVAMHAGY